MNAFASGFAALCLLAAAASASAHAGELSGPAAAAATRQANAAGRVIAANPQTYLALLRTLRPGDTLQLAAGRYDYPDSPPGLPLFDLHGTADRPITIEGPTDGPRAILVGRQGFNTVRFRNASHLILRQFDIDSANLGGDGVKAQGTAHDITLEDLVIRGVGPDQSVVAISTNGGTTWNWVIRRNRIVDAGTGMYLGNSDGRRPFMCGLIEHNLVADSLGYNLQVKHQLPRELQPGMPSAPCRTIIRHNVFSKARSAATGPAARPNVLVGHFPPHGPGSADRYEVYGNVFYENPSEALFQGEGNVALYSNLFINRSGSAVHIQPHNDLPRNVLIFGNTILARDAGIRLRNQLEDGAPNVPAPGAVQRVVANAVFAGLPISAPAQEKNVVDALERAPQYLIQPEGGLDSLDLRPRSDALRATAIDAAALGALTERDRDFDGAGRDWTRRGAYAAERATGHWRIRLDIKPARPADVSGTAASPARGK